MLIDENTYEDNKIARKVHPCINPRCDNFVEIQNDYNICLRCFDMLVEYLGSEHKVFDYGAKPSLKCMTTKQMQRMLQMAELEFPFSMSRKRGSSNSQRRWICNNEATENENFGSPNSQTSDENGKQA